MAHNKVSGGVRKMGINEKLSRKAEAFISVRELVTSLAESEGASAQKAAAWLLGEINQARGNAPLFITQDRITFDLYKAGDGELAEILGDVARNGNLTVIPFISDHNIDDAGWHRGKMTAFLADKGIALTDANQAQTTTPLNTSEPPYWHKIYNAKSRVTVDEAAKILCGLNPAESVPFGINDEEAWAELRAYRGLIFDAIDSSPGMFNEGSWGMDREDQSIDREAIQAWAENNGFDWPLSKSTKAHQPESPEGRKMAQELEAAKEKIRKLEAESKTITGQTMDKLTLAVSLFPGKYPNYKTVSPKLDADVRPWLKETENIKATDRESHVFGAILSEHFGF
ncbi:MAG: hypothetical protein RIR18_1542 [Pseudomonadota bacterium]